MKLWALVLLAGSTQAMAAGPWADFLRDLGRTPDLSVDASYTPDHGLVLHGRGCDYAADGKLGCHEPDRTDLGCSAPVPLTRGAVWLHLHRAVYAPYASGEGLREVALPMWLYAGARLASGSIALWGYGERGQELWLWGPESDQTARKVLDGPAALSGGVAAWPGEPECLALAYYKPRGDVCEGTSEVVRWCEGETRASAPVASWDGCSGRILALQGGILNLEGDLAGDFYPFDGAMRRLAAPAGSIAIAATPDGEAVALRLDAASGVVLEPLAGD